MVDRTAAWDDDEKRKLRELVLANIERLKEVDEIKEEIKISVEQGAESLDLEKKDLNTLIKCGHRAVTGKKGTLSDELSKYEALSALYDIIFNE